MIVKKLRYILEWRLKGVGRISSLKSISLCSVRSLLLSIP